MGRRIAGLFAALFIGLPATSLPASGQARVVFTVFQSLAGGGQIPAVGAAVCFSSLSNTKITNGAGQVTFENIPPGSWSGAAWRSGFRNRAVNVTVPAGALMIPAVVLLTERSNDAPSCVLPTRLGEERLPERGRAPLTTGDNKMTLDCDDFGQSSVMVGITGKQGEGVDELRVVCASMRSGGSLSPVLQFTSKWDQQDDRGTSFGRHCPSGRVVSGMHVTVHPESRQIRSITIECKTVGTNGLTAGTALVLAPAGIPSTTAEPFDRCSSGRPARAVRAGTDSFSPMFPRLLAPWIVATTQLICEQPMVP